MSQKAVMVRVNDELYQEVLSSVPDYEDAIRICMDCGYKSDDYYVDDYIYVEYEWLDIGEGESGMDVFYDDETLLSMYESGKYESEMEKDGHYVDSIESGTHEVYFGDLD